MIVLNFLQLFQHFDIRICTTFQDQFYSISAFNERKQYNQKNVAEGLHYLLTCKINSAT